MRRGKRSRGQALTELALIAPVIVMLMLGAADLGRAYYLNMEIAGASRAGMRNGVFNGNTDIGAATRSEPNSAILNNTATWGDTGPGGLNDCNPSVPGHQCGDSQGCPPSVFSGTRLACFAVRTCTLSGGVTTCGGLWGSRPAQGADNGTPPSNQVLLVHVVYKFVPVTPLIANYGQSGAFYLFSDTYGLELY